MSVKARRWVFGIAAVLGLANLVAYLAYTLPRSMQKRNVATRVEQLKGELAEERSRVAGLKARADAIVANRKESEAFLKERVQAAGASLVPLLSEVESLAKQQGLSVGSQSFTRESVAGLPLERFEINMPITGSYDQVTGLLSQLERSTFFLTLDEISARQQASANSPGAVGLNLLFSAYFRAGGEAASR